MRHSLACHGHLILFWQLLDTIEPGVLVVINCYLCDPRVLKPRLRRAAIPEGTAEEIKASKSTNNGSYYITVAIV